MCILLSKTEQDGDNPIKARENNPVRPYVHQLKPTISLMFTHFWQERRQFTLRTVTGRSLDGVVLRKEHEGCRKHGPLDRPATWFAVCVAEDRAQHRCHSWPIGVAPFPVLTAVGTLVLVHCAIIHTLQHESWKVRALKPIISRGRRLTTWPCITASSVVGMLLGAVQSLARTRTFRLTGKVSLSPVYAQAVMVGLVRKVLRGGGTRDAVTWGKSLLQALIYSHENEGNDTCPDIVIVIRPNEMFCVKALWKF